MTATDEIRDLIAQMIISPVAGTSLDDREAARLSALRPGGVILIGDNIGTDDEIMAFTEAIKATVPDRPPLLWVDQEGGVVRRMKSDHGPDQPEMGSLDLADVAAAATARSELVLRYGFDVNCTPVADVAFRPDSFMGKRSFGPDPEADAERVAVTVRAMNAARVIGSAKHFPGHGRTAVDSHVKLPVVDVSYDEWLETDAVPFRAAIAAGVPTVMLGHLMFPNWPRWGDAPATFNPEAYRVLRDVLGFDGAIVTDALGMGALDDSEPLDIVDRAMDCGIDLLLFVSERATVEEVADHLTRRAVDGQIDRGRIDASLARIAPLRAVRYPGR